MKRSKAEQVSSRKKAKVDKPSLNLFEVKVNKKKHDILGQKSKSDRGLPGVSRSKGIKKRKKTLLTEYKQAHKTNQFIDRRIGEHDSDLTQEERLAQRFIKQNKRRVEKAHLFNLEEDDLTHYGQSLAEMDDFDEIRISSESEDEEGQLKGDHFGGFLRKATRNEDGEKVTSVKKSRKEMLEEVVAKSKAAKFEKQETKRQVEDLLEEVDREWKDVKDFLGKNKAESEKYPQDEFDRLARELAFAPRGKAASRTKDEEETASEEKKKLEKLESEKLRRMRQPGLTFQEQSEFRHISADALVTGRSTKRDTRVMLAYQDGKAVVDLRGEGGQKSTNDRSMPLKGVSHDDDDDDDDDEDDDDDDAGSQSSDGDIETTDGNHFAKKRSRKGAEESMPSVGEEEEGENLESDASTSGDDVDPAEEFGSDLDSSEDEGETIAKKDRTLVPEKRSKAGKKKSAKSLSPKAELNEITLPETVEELKALLDTKDPKTCSHIVSTICDMFNPDKSKMKDFLETLVELVLEECRHPDRNTLATAGELSRHIYSLGQAFPTHVATLFQHLLDSQIREDLDSVQGRRSGVTFSKLMVFKLVSLLFPTSDYSHPIATPAKLLMGRQLSEISLSTLKGCCGALFLCQLFLEYETLSRWFVPEVVTTLRALLQQLCKANSPESQQDDLLNLDNLDCESKFDTLSLLDVVVAIEKESPPPTVCCLVVAKATLSMVIEFSGMWSDLPSAREIFGPILNFVNRLEGTHVSKNDDFRKLLSRTKSSLEKVCSKKKEKLLMLKQKAQSITFHEPRFNLSFAAGRRKSHSKTDSENKVLVHRVRRETKGAMREIRKDSSFLARQKQKEQKERDAERIAKDSRLRGIVAMEWSDAKAEKRKKK